MWSIPIVGLDPVQMNHGVDVSGTSLIVSRIDSRQLNQAIIVGRYSTTQEGLIPLERESREVSGSVSS